MAQQQALGDESVDLEWYQTNSRRWEAEQLIARQVLRDVECRIENSKAVIVGTFDVRSTHGYVYESVRVSIHYPKNFLTAESTPTVFLLSHRDKWVQVPDAHINSDWSLCLYVPGESGIDFRESNSLNALFAVIQTFLFKEWRFQKELAREPLTKVAATWLGPARSHGWEGVREAIHEMRRPARNGPCPCGSGKKLKRCCMRNLNG